MQIWRALDIIQDDGNTGGEYHYAPQTKYHAIVDELAHHYRIQRHKIYGFIFSPLKKARDFADAFRKIDSKDGKKDG